MLYDESKRSRMCSSTDSVLTSRPSQSTEAKLPLMGATTTSLLPSTKNGRAAELRQLLDVARVAPKQTHSTEKLTSD